MDIIIENMNITHFNKIKDILTDEFDDFWTPNILKEELESNNSFYFVALYKNEIVGFAGVKILLDQADIMNIVTKKTYRNFGIGSKLLDSLISFCNNENLKSLTLEVNEENVPAIALYNKFGFEIIGTRKNYYKDKNGIIMQKNYIK